MNSQHQCLLDLCHAAAEPALDLVVAGEGNASVATDRGTLVVTSTGSRLREVDEDAVVEISPDVLLDALDGDDRGWDSALRQCGVRHAPAVPTVEAGLHAVIAHETGADTILHTHPTSLLAVLCSGRGAQFARSRLFPDQIVLGGRRDCFVPYVSPGRQLAMQVRDALRAHKRAHGSPRVVLLESHGMVAFGGSPRMVLELTLMTVKAARVMLLGSSPGQLRPLPDHSVAEIDERGDEQYRRAVLGHRGLHEPTQV